MDNTRIVSIGRVRELLAVLDRARAEILSGRVSGVFAAFQDDATGESIYLAGSYKADPVAAMNAGMKAAASSSLSPLDEVAPPPRFRVSGM